MNNFEISNAKWINKGKIEISKPANNIDSLNESYVCNWRLYKGIF